MILHHFQNRQKKNSEISEFFLGKRRVFFVDVNIKNSTNIFSTAELSDTEKKKQEREIRETNRERLRIQRTLKTVKNPDDITGEIKEELDVFYSKNSELVNVVLKEKFRNSQALNNVLETLKEDPEKEKEEVDTFFFEIDGNTPNSKHKALVMKIPPQKFLDEYVGDDKKKRKNYFRALSYLDPQKISTLTFVQKCNTEKFSRFLKELSVKEQKVFLGVFIATNKHHNNESLQISQLKNNEMKNNIISYARDESLKNLSLSEKEEKMLAKVRLDFSLGNTGEKTAEHIKKELEKHKNKTKNERERQKIFFRILREASSSYLQKLKHKGRQEILDSITDSRNFYTGLFSLSNLSEAEKRKDLQEIEKVYDMFTDFFSGKKNGDVARFYLKNKGLTPEEVQEIDAIENKKAQVEEKLLTLGSEYQTRIAEIYQIDGQGIKTTQELKNLATHYHLSLPVFKKVLVKKDALRPSDFSDFRKELNGFGFSALPQIDSLIEEPFSIHHSIDKKVLIQWTKERLGTGFLRIVSSRVIRFYSTSEHQKKSKMVTRFSHFEEVMSDDITSKRKLSDITLTEELKAEFKEKTSPEYIQIQLKKSQYEFEEIRLLLNKNGFNYGKKSFPQFSNAEIKAQSQKFSQQLVLLMKKNAERKNPLPQSEMEEIILDELQNLGIDGKVEKLQNEKQAIQKHIAEGTLHPYIRGKGLQSGKEGFSLLTNSVSSRKNPEKTISIPEQNFLNFIKKFSSLSQKISEGKFKKGDLQNFLDIKNTNGESLVIPLSRTDKPIENFEKESDSGIVFDPQSGHIIVSDELHREMQEFPEMKHVRMLSHEVGHLWANKSSLEQKARKLLRENNLLDYLEKNFLEIFPNKTGQANAVEEVFSELLAASQFKLSNYKKDGFFEINLGLGEKMTHLLKLVISRLGEENIQKILEESSSEFLKNADIEKTAVGKESSGLSMTEAQKEKYEQQAKEDCETHYGSNNENSNDDGEKFPLINDKKLARHQADAKIKEDNTNALFRDIEKYKSSLPQYSSDIDEFLEKHKQFLQEDLEDISGSLVNMTEKDAEEIMTHIGKINDNAREFSGQLAEALEPEENYLESLWAGTRFLSLKDLGKMWDTAYESIKRRLDRRAKARMGEAGDAMFSGIWDGLANEFDKDVQNAEKEEVGDIQGALENKNTPGVYDYLENASNPDEAKAALQHLSSGGMIDWNKKEITKTLSRLGSGVPFYDSDFDNPDIRNRKLKKAFTRVWGDEEMFTDMFNENDGNISSNVDKYAKEASTNVGMTGNIKEMMKDHQKGDWVDPNRYEGYVKQMAIDAKGAPGEPFFWLVYGVAHGLIPIQSFNRLDTLQNNYSISNFLSDSDWTVEDTQKWCKEIMWDTNKGDYVEPQNVKSTQIDHWLYKNVFTQSNVFERTNSNVSQRGFDHDHGRLFYSVGSSESAVAFLAAKSTGAPEIKQTAYTNATAGMMEHIASLALQEEDFDKEVLRHTVARQAGYFTAFNAVSSGRIDTKKKSKYKFSPANYNEKPREGGAYNGDMTTRDFVDAQEDLYSSVYTKEFKDFLKDIAYGKDLRGRHKDIAKKLKKYEDNPDKYPLITDAIKKSDVTLISEDTKDTGTDFYETLVPALFNYFLDPPADAKLTKEEADQNLNSILAKTRSISAGNCNPKWANTGGDSNVKESKLSKPPEKSSIPSEKFAEDFDEIFGGHNQ